MKHYFLIFGLMAVVGCKDAPKEKQMASPQVVQETVEKETRFPQQLVKVFDAHGGLAKWKEMRTLSYTLPKKDTKEIHTTDLYSRMDKIELGTLQMGFDGTEVWLLDTAKSYKGDPIFYHNLMFYFYAMPFIVADNGIQYDTAEPLTFDGVVYPGIRIYYDEGIGVSPKDEYYVHYHPDTHEMEWLGYTVTYRTGTKSDNVKWIRYGDWMPVNGLLMPKTLSWYSYEGRTLLEPQNSYTFENVVLEKTSKPVEFYALPENAMVVTKTE